jgi:predicted RNA methylase
MQTGENKRDALRGFVQSVGYSDEMIRQEFPVWVGEEVRVADVVAFGRPHPEPQDQTTSAILGATAESEFGVGQAITMATAIAAPAAVIARPDSIDVWAVAAGGHHEKVHQLGYRDAVNPPTALIRELGPRSLTAVKEGAYQPALFPSDVGSLLQEARRKSASRLVTLVENTALHLSSGKALSTPRAKQEEVSRISRLLVGAMAALMVSDKVLVDRAQSSASILKRAEERFPTYFHWTQSLDKCEREDLLSTIMRLGADVSYAGLDPSVVASVYESAILDTAKRADFGVFYTPPELAKRVLAQIPIEELDPSQRSVLDPSCGSGTFLLASYDRLRNVAPLNLDLIEAHHDSAKRLTGFDVDPLAVEVARLALLLNAMPASNGWSVAHADALSEEAKTKASVVVSNPPWRDIRSEQGRRVQLADRFLLRMLESVEARGFLAAVVPAGWLVSSASRETRETLAANCSLFEIWRLPQDTFPGADIDVAVILARKDHSPGSYVFRRVRRAVGWKNRFLDAEEPGDEVLLRHKNSALRRSTWTHGPLDRFKEKLEGHPLLASTAVVQKGPVPTPPVSTKGGEGSFLWLPTLKGTYAYAQPRSELLKAIRYPDDFNWRKGDGSIYRKPKVLISGVRNPDVAWRIKVVPDLNQGIIPRDSMIMVVPDDPDDALPLTALLGSSFVSCWVDTVNPGRSIPVSLYKKLPLPVVQDWKITLRQVGKRLVEQAEKSQLDPTLLREADQCVLECYELPATTYKDLARYFEGMPAPEGEVRYPVRRVKAVNGQDRNQTSYGTVLELGTGKLKLWIAGTTPEEGEWVPLPPGFPGSQLHPGATFEISLPDKEIKEGRFKFQSESYLDLEDVVVAGDENGQRRH